MSHNMAKMRRIEIVLEHDQIEEIKAALARDTTGYTIVPNVGGFGHHGARSGELAILVAIVTAEHVQPIVDAVVPLLRERSGVITVSDVHVARGEYFVPELKAKQP